MQNPHAPSKTTTGLVNDDASLTTDHRRELLALIPRDGLHILSEIPAFVVDCHDLGSTERGQFLRECSGLGQRFDQYGETRVRVSYLLSCS